uniref:Putative secreted protein n=1 Tax=Anopheles darlingi TaxID=43151 RepID=A0A2M4DHI7_ANODA
MSRESSEFSLRAAVLLLLLLRCFDSSSRLSMLSSSLTPFSATYTSKDFSSPNSPTRRRSIVDDAQPAEVVIRSRLTKSRSFAPSSINPPDSWPMIVLNFSFDRTLPRPFMLADRRCATGGLCGT